MKKNKVNLVLKNITYSFSSNILSLIITAALVLFIPKFVGVEEYGYYQLYTFYISYVGVSCFGWCDGIYLRIGGEKYDDLSPNLYSAHFVYFVLYEIIFFAMMLLFAVTISNDSNKDIVYAYICAAAIPACLRIFIVSILQATAKAKEFSVITITESIIYMTLSLIFIFLGYRQFYFLLLASTAAKYISTGIGIWYCRKLFFAKPIMLKKLIPEIKEDVKCGYKLILSSLCSMLIIGVVRIGIENHWNIATFGKISLTLSISNMIFQAINAISVVLYPILRRTRNEYLTSIYGTMRVVLMTLVFGGLIFYYPIQKILMAWLPQYADSLRYAAILLPMCVYETKMSMLINTYYKTLRMEKILMKCNIASLLFSVTLTLLSTLVFDNIMTAVFSILIVLIFRCVLSEVILSRKIRIKVINDIILEIIMTVSFIICNWYFGFIGMVVYMICYILYLLLKKNDIKHTVYFFKSVNKELL